MCNQAFSKIWIIVIIVLICGGILAWQYFRMPEKEVEAPEGIEKPYIKVISPNGGERWVRGNTYRVSWGSEGIDHVTIRLSYFRKEDEAIAILSNNPGFYDWSIPSNQTLGNQYSITIVQYTPDAPDIMDSSDNYFSIVSADETANWKTYRNEKAKYELKYPPDFEVKEPDYTATAEFVDIAKMGFPGWYTIESHWILDPRGEVIAEQLIESLSNTNKVTTHITINNLPAIQLTADSPLGGRFTEIYIEKYGDVYIISYSGDNEQGLKIFNQILSTFRFLE